MAIIAQRALATLIAKAADDGESHLSENGALFYDLLKNGTPNSSKYDPGFSCSGVELCYGDTDGFPAIMRAFRNLREPINPLDFGERIAQALQAIVDPYPTGENNLMYPHFLLHGIALDTAEQAVQKILENARILSESKLANERVTKEFGRAKSQLGEKYFLTLVNGFGDDFEALSLQLIKRRCEINPNDEMFAKAGFHIDTPNRTAYICNLQGRLRSRSKDREGHKRELKKGREYGRFSHIAGVEPREFVLNALFEFLKEIRIDVVRAIRPEEHLARIGKHVGFKGKYDQILAQVGMEIENDVYRIKKLA